jgi:DNA replication ATP-dependent helicase Dna2
MLSTLQQLESEIIQERDLQSQQMHKQWRLTLPERVDAGRALGGLVIDSIDVALKLIHFIPPSEDFAFFKEQQRIRVSQNSPDSHHFIGTFIGLTDKGLLSIKCSACDTLDFEHKSGWSIDEEFVDVSDFYMQGLKSLAEDAHGRDNVYPVLFKERPSTIDAETYEDTYDALDESDSPLNDPQKDSVATALAASPMHLIQGPPGTGKTQTLARLVEQLVIQGHRILITGFTHRSIHQALTKIHAVIEDQCPVVKIGAPITPEKLPFPTYESLEESDLDTHPGPYVIGATPFALYTKRLRAAHFDSAVVDETSQLTLPAAIMVMMKSDRWFFFGDDKQLPPVTQLHRDDPSAASIFARLKKQTEFTTLSITYRMNQQLTEWPSEMFYSGELETFYPDNKFTLKSQPITQQESLSADHSLVSIKLPCDVSKSYNDDEADLTAAIIEELLNSGTDPAQIGVITPFRAQSSRIRTLLRNVIAPPHRHLERSIIVDTVDRFQGQEREVILYSFASSDSSFIRKVHPFLFNAARLNVAVTRARTKVILLYSQGLLDYAEINANTDELSSLFLSLLDLSHPVKPPLHGEVISE